MRTGPRVAVLSPRTSPLDQPGTGDAGGMAVDVVELAQVPAGQDARGRRRRASTGASVPVRAVPDAAGSTP